MIRRGHTEGICCLALRACLIVDRHPSKVCRPIGIRPRHCALPRTRWRVCRAYAGLVLACCCFAVSGGGLACQWPSSQPSNAWRTT